MESSGEFILLLPPKLKMDPVMLILLDPPNCFEKRPLSKSSIGGVSCLSNKGKSWSSLSDISDLRGGSDEKSIIESTSLSNTGGGGGGGR